MHLKTGLIELEQLEGIRSAWTELLKRSASRSIFVSWEWMSAWLHTFGAGRKCILIGVWREETLTALAPLWRSTDSGKSVWQIWGTSDLDPDGLDLIAERGSAPVALLEIARFLSSSFVDWAELRLDALSQDSVACSAAPSLRSIGRVHVERTQECPTAVIRGSFREHLESVMNSKHRKAIQARLRALEAKHGLVQRRASDSKELDQALTELLRLHAERKSDLGAETRFQGPTIERFHRELIALTAGLQWLVVYGLYKDDRPVSLLYCFEYDNSQFVYQSGLDPAWTKVGVGSALLHLALRDCCERKLVRQDLSRGALPYKMLIANHMSYNARVRFYQRSLRGSMEYVQQRALSAARHWLRGRRSKSGSPGRARSSISPD